MNSAVIFTDGSCHTQKRMGAWVAIIFVDGAKTVLSGIVPNITHNRMELTGVLKALDYIKKGHQQVTDITIISDSQYVIGIPLRAKKLCAADFTTKKGKPIQNDDLVKQLLQYEKGIPLEFEKIKAHQKQEDILNYNIEADKLCRSLVRQAILDRRMN